MAYSQLEATTDDLWYINRVQCVALERDFQLVENIGGKRSYIL